jgi:hypothetical protein
VSPSGSCIGKFASLSAVAPSTIDVGGAMSALQHAKPSAARYVSVDLPQESGAERRDPRFRARLLLTNS